MFSSPSTGLYNASKAALAIGSETWRLELAPLGIRCVTLMTGGVKTNFFTNLNKKTVPENSYYYGVHDLIEGYQDGRMQANAPDAKEIAAQVVRAVDRGTTGKLYVGEGAAAGKWGLPFMPQWLIVSCSRSSLPLLPAL
jgi:NAD(P)-dependent dehydrogenase (short-subunit alcohol dehydrogenase family)